VNHAMKCPSIDQTVFAVIPGNRAHDKPETQEWIVRKLGREYYYASLASWPDNLHKISIETGREKTDWLAATVFLDLKEYRDLQDASDLRDKIRKQFDGYATNPASKFKLTTLRQIWHLIEQDSAT